LINNYDKGNDNGWILYQINEEDEIDESKTKEKYKFIKIKSLEYPKLSDIKFSKNGNWIAYSSSKLCNLCVYDFNSETFILKQEGHTSLIKTISYNNTGDLFASADENGSIKVYSKGLSFITINKHKGKKINNIRTYNINKIFKTTRFKRFSFVF
jgi:WD40 repeat protein